MIYEPNPRSCEYGLGDFIQFYSAGTHDDFANANYIEKKLLEAFDAELWFGELTSGVIFGMFGGMALFGVVGMLTLPSLFVVDSYTRFANTNAGDGNPVGMIGEIRDKGLGGYVRHIYHLTRELRKE